MVNEIALRTPGWPSQLKSVNTTCMGTCGQISLTGDKSGPEPQTVVPRLVAHEIWLEN
jgi:hypothetical protein